MIEYNVLIKWGKHNKILKHETKTLYTKQFMNNCRIMIQETFRNLWRSQDFIFTTLKSLISA